METNNSHHRRISSIRGIPFIVLAVLFVAGGIIFFSKWRFAQPGSQPHLNIPANSNNAMFGFDLQRTRFNQSERILNITNVSHLVPYWSASTAAYINSSPAVANGIVYIADDVDIFSTLTAAHPNSLPNANIPATFSNSLSGLDIRLVYIS